MATDIRDAEKGLVSATTRAINPSLQTSSSTSDHVNTNANTNTNGSSQQTPLQLFQLLIGIHTPKSLTQLEGIDHDSRLGARSSKRKREDNVGLYQRAKSHERASRLAFLSTSFISNTLYMLQILLAATFTALSSYKGTHPVILTVLGAMNTVVAGSLAWQKGQGVPQRYRKAQDQYQDLLLDIEMTERAFLESEQAISRGETGGDATMLDPRKENARLQKLFDTARADQQANYPDLYVSTGATAAKDASDLNKQLEDAKAAAEKVQSEMMAKIEMLMSKLESKVDGHIEAAAITAQSALKL